MVKSENNSEYKNESQLESDFYQHLIDSGKYCLIKRQYKTSIDDTRLDIICIDSDFQLIIFELKMRLNMKAIEQADSYRTKYIPKQCYVVFHSPLSTIIRKKIETDSTEIGIIEFRENKINIIRESPIDLNSQLPEDMMLRLNADYLTKNKIITLENSWFTDMWRNYSIQKMIEMGYITEKYRRK